MPPKNIFDIYNKGMRARLTTPGLNYDNSIGGLPNYSIMPDNSFINPSNTTLNNTTSNNTGDSNDVTGNNELGIATAFVKGFDTLSDAIYYNDTPLSDNKIYDVAMRGTAQDRHLVNQLGALISGNSNREKEVQDAVDYAKSSGVDFSRMYARGGSIDSLVNAWNPNVLQSYVDVPEETYDNLDAVVAAHEINHAIDLTNYGTLSSFDEARDAINKRNLRQNMMNYFDEGGDMGNGITMFNTGGSHEQTWEIGKEYNVDENTYNQLIRLGYGIEIIR